MLAGLLLARGALFLALGLAMGFPGGTPWGRFVVFTALSWAVSMTLYALQQGLSLRFANQAVALVCGIFGSFVGLMALLFPVWVQRCVPWGYYGLLSLVRMEWDEATRWTAFFWRRPEPWIWPSCACGRPSFSLWDGLCSSERRYEAWYCAVSGRS